MKEHLQEVLSRPPTTAAEAERAARAAEALAAYLRLEEEVATLLAPAGSHEASTGHPPGLAGAHQTLHDVAAEVLAEAGVPLHVRELGRRIKARGWKHPRTKAPRPDQIFYQLAARLPRHPDRFVRVAPNTFALAAWDEAPLERPAPRLGLFGGQGKPTGREIGDAAELPASAAPWRSS
jgi:hypothetical protein